MSTSSSSCTPGGSKINGRDALEVGKYDVSTSTGRRYNQVVQEYVKSKMEKSDSIQSNIPPQVLTLNADKAGPEEGSYVSWEGPDTPNSRKFVTGNQEETFGSGEVFRGGSLPPESSPSKSEFKASFVSAKDSQDSEGCFTPLQGSQASSSFTDPFSSNAKNVVHLSFSSMQTSDDDAVSSRASRHSQDGSDVIPVFPKASFIQSPDRDLHGTPMTTFSKEDPNLSDVPLNTPTGTRPKDRTLTPRTPTIRVTSVQGSSHDLHDGQTAQRQSTNNSRDESPATKRMPRSSDSDIQENLYPPEESDTKTYNFMSPNCSSRTFIYCSDKSGADTPESPQSSKSSTRNQTSVSPSWHVPEDFDYNVDKSDYDIYLDRMERFGWFLIIAGTALLISAVIAILVIEIPAHREEILGAYPRGESMINYLETFKGYVLPPEDSHKPDSST